MHATYRSLVCVPLLLVAPAARAEILLTEVDATIDRFFNFDGRPQYISVGPFFNGPFVRLSVLADPQFTLEWLPPPISAPYAYTFDPGLSGLADRVESGFGFEAFAAAVQGEGSHSLHDLLTFQAGPADEDHYVNVPTTDLWGGGAGGDGLSSYSVVSDYTPPNGQNLAGTNYHVSAVELTVTGLEVEPNWEGNPGPDAYINGFIYTIEFDFKLYAIHVPEPSTTALWWCTFLSLAACRRTYSCR